MPNNIIHIGFHKTGTTWFQKRLYPHISNYALIERRTIQRALLWDSAFHFSADNARYLLKDASAGKPMIISEEELSGTPHTSGMYGYASMEIARRLHALDPHARVVIFIRRQTDMAASIYQQYVREGGTHSPQRYFFPERYRKDVARHPFKYPVFNFQHLEYLGLLRHYRDLFGAGRVKVCLFEHFQEDPRQFTNEYMNDLDLDAGDASIDYGAANRSYNPYSLHIMRILNQFSYRSVMDKHYIANLLSNKLRSDLGSFIEKALPTGSQGSGGILNQALKKSINDRFRHSNALLAQEFNLPLEQYGYALEL